MFFKQQLMDLKRLYREYFVWGKINVLLTCFKGLDSTKKTNLFIILTYVNPKQEVSCLVIPSKYELSNLYICISYLFEIEDDLGDSKQDKIVRKTQTQLYLHFKAAK